MRITVATPIEPDCSWFTGTRIAFVAKPRQTSQISTSKVMQQSNELAWQFDGKSRRIQDFVLSELSVGRYGYRLWQVVPTKPTVGHPATGNASMEPGTQFMFVRRGVFRNHESSWHYMAELTRKDVLLVLAAVPTFECRRGEHRVRLAGIDLSELDLHGLNLAHADLAGSDLRACNLTDCRLSDADFSKADLTDAVLRGVYAEGATFVEAKLVRADFRSSSRDLFYGTHLNGADFEGADLTDARFDNDGIVHGDTSSRSLARISSYMLTPTSYPKVASASARVLVTANPGQISASNGRATEIEAA